MNNKNYLPYNKSLDGFWKLYIAENKDVSDNPLQFKTGKELETSGYLCIDGKVPGNFELDMQREGLLDDVFFGENPLKLQELENRHLWYVKSFEYECADTQDTFFQFKGIDTFAEIYLNGSLLAKTDNMLIPYEFSVADFLVSGENELVVHIIPTSIESRKYPIGAGAFNHNKYNAESLTVRKAPHMYGWDIMVRALSGGLWRSVSIIKKPAERIEEFYLYPFIVNEQVAISIGYYQVNVKGDFIREYSLKVKGVCGSSVFEIVNDMWSACGNFEIHIPNPKLWWTKGRGLPNLYDVRVELYHGEELCDWREFKFGVRSVQLIRTSVIDENNKGDFRFRVNGEDVFMCGTNWVPLDAFHSRDLERLPKALELLENIGCNMVRCWGGNVYESEEFFDYCDEHGIAVWQDFAMACAVYPRTNDFLERMGYEVETVVKQLRQHPSIFIWSGDNECDESVTWRSISPDPNHNILTRKLIPQIIRNVDPIRYFLPSSPYIDEIAFSDRSKPLPEAHLWGPRDYYKNEFYSEAKTRFASETGYHGCPSPESIKRFISKDKLWPPTNNDEWIVHATSMEKTEGPYNFRISLMVYQVARIFGNEMDNLNDFAIASQISQAEAFKFFIERFRYGKPERTGILWWNLLDGWPQFSDAVVDYYYNRKLAYFVIKRSQNPLCLMFKEPDVNGTLTFCAVSDMREDSEISYTVENVATNELIISGKAEVKADAVTDIAQIDTSKQKFAFYLIKWKNGSESGVNHYIFGEPTYDYEKVVECFKKSGLLNIEGF